MRGLIDTLKFYFNSPAGRKLIYAALTPDELLIANTQEGLSYVVNSSDKAIGLQMFIDRHSYDSQHLTQCLEILGIQIKQKIIFDVGANIGPIGIFAVSKGLFSNCIAFEPCPNNFKMLEANVILNGLKDKFKLHNVALSTKKGEHLLFELSEDNFGDHRVQVNKNPGLFKEESREVITVTTDSLDDVCEGINLDECMLFMDTQGFEGHVLSGGKKILQAGMPIITEFWPYGLLRANGLELFYSALASAKYTAIYQLSEPNNRIAFSVDSLRTIREKITGTGCTELLFVNEA